MKELLMYVLSSPEVFIGTLVLMVVGAWCLSSVVEAFRSKE